MTVGRARLEEQRRMNGNGGVMWDGRRPRGRLFYVLLSVLLLTAVSRAQAPAMTTISDVVYRADGTPAAGTLLISWPAFTTADGKPVAAGTKSVMLGAQGVLSVALAPNTGRSRQARSTPSSINLMMEQ